MHGCHSPRGELCIFVRASGPLCTLSGPRTPGRIVTMFVHCVVPPYKLAVLHHFLWFRKFVMLKANRWIEEGAVQKPAVPLNVNVKVGIRRILHAVCGRWREFSLHGRATHQSPASSISTYSGDHMHEHEREQEDDLSCE